MFVTALPNQESKLVQYFMSPGTFTWEKPPGVSLVSITCVGPGSDGGAGASAVSGTAKLGGFGGGSGAVTTGIFSASMLPDTLYITNGAGNSGANTAVYIDSLSSGAGLTYNWATLVRAEGALASNTTPGIANANNNFNVLGTYGFINSRTGSRGVAGTTGKGANQTSFATNTLWVTGGAAGGGGTTSATSANVEGGSITSNTTVAILNNIFNGVPGASLTNTIQASGGFKSLKPLIIFTGGAGGPGATTLSVAAYPGGDGAPGCGGGGGGGGTTGSAGGKGGNGFTIISCK